MLTVKSLILTLDELYKSEAGLCPVAGDGDPCSPA